MATRWVIQVRADSHAVDFRIMDGDTCVALTDEEHAPLIAAAPLLREALRDLMKAIGADSIEAGLDAHRNARVALAAADIGLVYEGKDDAEAEPVADRIRREAFEEAEKACQDVVEHCLASGLDEKLRGAHAARESVRALIAKDQA